MIWLANAVPQTLEPQPFSWRVLVTLLLVLVLSAVTFTALVRRWTTQRHRIVLSDWAKGKGFRVSAPESAPNLPQNPKTVLRCIRAIGSDNTWLLELFSETTIVARWHVLLRAIEQEWDPSGLRPAHGTRSLLDLYSLSSFPALGNVERFVVYGTESRSARKLSKSALRGLLPADIGLLLHGKWLILDFSARPFDPIEFDRMTAVAEQLVGHLPGASPQPSPEYRR
ncbi:MAG TPA: hypothetical protein VF669_20575 [Tepidisphaeraceae bacterium]|jgi:hypothetical protein